MTEDRVDGAVGGVTRLALSDNTIFERHVATRASNRRRIIVYVLGDAEFEGYSIGLDAYHLQLLDLGTGEVSSITREHIVAVTDGKPFNELTPAEKDIVDRRTSSFRKHSSGWLVENWPDVYDRREEDDSAQGRQRFPNRRSYPTRYAEGRNHNADPQARD